MSGQTKKSKNQIVEEYIRRVNPYVKLKSPAFNLRGYANYIKEQGLKGSDITPEIMNRFAKVKG